MIVAAKETPTAILAVVMKTPLVGPVVGRQIES